MFQKTKMVWILAVITLTLLSLAAGSVLAQVSVEDNIILAAYQKSTGALRIISSENDAKGSEEVISWNIQGPQGPPGELPVAEPWHEVGAEGEPPFGNNLWFNYDETFYNTVGFYKDPFGVVHLKGVVYSWGAEPSLDPIFRLPEGYRPAKNQLFIAPSLASQDEQYTMRVLLVGNSPTGLDGDLYVTNYYLGMPFSLDGITFRAEE